MFQKLCLFISRLVYVISNPHSGDVLKLQDLKHCRRNCAIAIHACTGEQLPKYSLVSALFDFLYLVWRFYLPQFLPTHLFQSFLNDILTVSCLVTLASFYQSAGMELYQKLP